MAPLKLLIVEDDVVNLELMTEVFTTLHAEVIPLNSSERAVTVVDHERFDGIFLDLEMPKVNGFDLARRIRMSTWNKSTPVIVVTGRDDRQTMQQAFDIGATYFLQKPVDRQKLTNLYKAVRGGLLQTRRRHLRVPFETEVSFRRGDKTVRGVSKNLSQGGMQVETSELFLGETVQLLFKISSLGAVVEAIGSVLWSKDNLRGISFLKISEEHHEVLRKFVTDSEKTEH